jgi:phosphate-selective porin
VLGKEERMRRFVSGIAAVMFGCAIIYGSVGAQGCMDAKSEEGVSIAGFVQTHADYYQETSEFGFKFKRVRLAALGNIPYDVSYYVVVEYSPFLKSQGLLDAYITFSRFGPYTKFSVGQFKSPFSMELNTSCAGLHTINRSKVVDNLASPGRDIGVMLFGEHEKLLSYSIGVMNGTGMGIVDDNFLKDYVGRVVLSPIDFLSIGASYRNAIVGPDEVDEKTRFGGEVQLKYGDFLVQSEYIMGKYIGTTTDEGGGGCGAPGGCDFALCSETVDTTESHGLYLQGMYMTKFNVQPVLKYEFWLSDKDVEKEKIQITTIGVNWFINDWTRFQINYLYCAEPDFVEFDNDQVLMQFQVKF